MLPPNPRSPLPSIVSLAAAALCSALGGCAPPAGAAQAHGRRFVAVLDHPELDRADAYRDVDGAIRSRDGKPVPDRCIERCAFAVPRGARVVGCRAASAGPEVASVLHVGEQGLVLCEIR